MPSSAPPPTTMPHVVRPPARTARIMAMVLSLVAIGFSIGFGITLRRLLPVFDRHHLDATIEQTITVLVLLLFAMLFRMAGSMCELVWLERTWSNMPPELRNVGPIENVSSGLAVVLSFVPGLAWIWKLGLAVAVCHGFEQIRTRIPFTAPIPKTLGVAAVVVSWVPGLNVYLAPFLWELFAIRMDLVVNEIVAGPR